ncbi:hypothetical protein [Desulfarculus baarsii]
MRSTSAYLSASVEPIQPRWLRLADAVRYSGLSKRRLKELVKAGELIGGQDTGDLRGGGDGTWVFDRLSIDQWRAGQLGEDTLRSVASTLAGSVL